MLVGIINDTVASTPTANHQGKAGGNVISMQRFQCELWVRTAAAPRMGVYAAMI